jgi:CBS domain-containing protein
MRLVRWDPFRELEEISTRLNRLFTLPFGRRLIEDEGSLMAEWAPAVDVQETDGEYPIKADLPDVRKEDVDVGLQDGLRGERRQEKEEKGSEVRQHEAQSDRGEGVLRQTGSAQADYAVELDPIVHSSVNVMVTASEAAERLAWARRIHEGVLHRDGPFVAVCPEINGQPGAVDVEEWFARAVRGTLFIDDIGQLSPDAQARLCSLLSAQSHRIGRATAFNSDGRVRVIAGSGRSLLADLAVGTFNDALFYRLNVIHIDEMHQGESGEHTMQAREVMSQPPYTCGPETDLVAVAKIMWDHDCGFVPVVDASGAVVGVITDRDICIATSTRHLLPEHISAAQAMASPIHACLSDDSVSDVLATMKQFRIRRVPVIDANGTLQGVVSINDLVLASDATRAPQASEIVSTMAAICGRRRVEAAVA